MSLGSEHCYINEMFSEKRKKEERGRKEGGGKKSAACLLGALFAIPFPMHLVCVCAGRERREQEGDGRLGPINNQ